MDDCDIKEWALAAWLLAAGRVINAPGHTAQYLRPTPGAFDRIRRTWSKSVWPLFLEALDELGPIGDRRWRKQNALKNSEALLLLETLHPDEVGAVYADPPYTKDQYSRFYHVYETLYHYDFPDSFGRARARSDRFSTEFSLATGVEEALDRLVQLTTELQRPLVLSYPSDGLLAGRGVTVSEVIERHRPVTKLIEITHRHSTLGAKQGSKLKDTTECIYVCA